MFYNFCLLVLGASFTDVIVVAIFLLHLKQKRTQMFPKFNVTLGLSLHVSSDEKVTYL